MLVWLKDVKGMWVAALREGRMLGTVSSFYMEADGKRLTGLTVRGKNPLGGEELWLEVGDVQAIGEDLMFLERAEQARRRETRGRRVSDLLGRTVSTQEGKVLGPLQDLGIETESWQIRELGLDRGRSVPLDPEQSVVGEDLILLQAGAEEEVAAGEDRPPGKSLSSVFGKEFMQQASEQVRKFFAGSEAHLPPRERPRPEAGDDSEKTGGEPPA